MSSTAVAGGPPARSYIFIFPPFGSSVLSDSGAFLRAIGTATGNPKGQLNGTGDVAVALRFPGPPVGSGFFGTGTVGVVADQLNSPFSVAVHESAPELGQPTLLFVADYSNSRAQVFDADSGEVVRTIGSNGVAGAALG